MDRWAAWRDGRGRRAFALPIAAGSDDAEVTALDRLSMTEWLDRHGWTSPRLRWLVDYSCRDDYGTTSDETSAWAGVFYFASRIRRPGMRSQPLITWPEGNGRMVAHLYGQAKDRVRLGWLVADIIPAGRLQASRGVDVVMMDRSGNDVRGLHAEQVIFAAPQFLASHVIRDYRQSPPAAHCASSSMPPGWWRTSSSTTGPAAWGFPWRGTTCSTKARRWATWRPRTRPCIDHGPTVLTYYYPFAGDSPRDARAELLAMDWEDCADLVLSDLGRAHAEIGTLVDRLDVMRWGHAMIRPRPGFLWGPARKAAARPYRGIHFGNTDLSGVALLEEAFYHGLRAAEEVLAARKVEFKSMLG